MTPIPLEIIGGGLAGLALGLALRREGIPVTVHEAGTYPRHRVCGEFIAGLSASTVARLRLAPFLAGAIVHHEVAWCREGCRPVVQRLPAPAVAISRYRLDAELAEAFVNAGGVLRTRSRVADLTAGQGRILATGRRAGPPRWVGLKIHVRDLSLACDLEMHLGRRSYVGLARIPEGVNLCGLFRVRPIRGQGAALLGAYLEAAGLNGLADRVWAARVDSRSFCAVAGLDFGRTTAAPGQIVLGDAGGMIPPFTGSGMATAFESAELAVGPLRDFARGACAWSVTCQRVNESLHRRFRLRRAAARALHPFLLGSIRQHCFSTLNRSGLLPFRSLYATLH